MRKPEERDEIVEALKDEAANIVLLIVNKSHEKSKTDNVLVCHSTCSDFPTLSVSLSPKLIGFY